MPPVRVDGVGFRSGDEAGFGAGQLPIGAGPFGMRTRMPPVHPAADSRRAPPGPPPEFILRV
jgi:hypothetical protein